jgi:surface carbohydrate biosynthesis protein
MKKIYKFLILLLNTKFIWTKPKPVDILIYDKNMSEFIIPYITKYKKKIIYTHLEKIYLYILFKLIIRFSLKNLLFNYTKIFVEVTKPKIVITATDNDINFYKLKMEIQSIKFKTIAIQNGHRVPTHPGILNYYADYEKNKMASDYILCFFSEQKNIYKKKIQCKSIAIGSFLNNINYQKKVYGEEKSTKNLFWISQYRYRKLDENIFNENFLSENQKKNFKNQSVEEHMNLESKILPIIYKFCKKNNIKFNILSSYKKKDNEKNIIEEKNFYHKVIDDSDWTMNENKKQSRIDAYKILLEEADIVAHVDSTLGYESLARGIKTISITAKKSFYKNIPSQFSWPSRFNYKGPIWTNSEDKDEILRLLNFICSVSNKDWIGYVHSIKDKIMQTDKDNKIFFNLIEKLLENEKI